MLHQQRRCVSELAGETSQSVFAAVLPEEDDTAHQPLVMPGTSLLVPKSRLYEAHASEPPLTNETAAANLASLSTSPLLAAMSFPMHTLETPEQAALQLSPPAASTHDVAGAGEGEEQFASGMHSCVLETENQPPVAAA